MLSPGADGACGWVEAVTAEGEVIHGRLDSPRFWLLAILQARRHRGLAMTAPYRQPLFYHFARLLATLYPSPAPRVHLGVHSRVHSGVIGARARSFFKPLALATAALAFGSAMFATGLSQGRGATMEFDRLQRQVLGGGVPKRAMASWRLFGLFAPQKVELFNRNLLDNLTKRAELRLDEQYKMALKADSMAAFLQANLTLSSGFKYRDLSPQLLAGGFGRRMEERLQKLEEEKHRRFRPKLLAKVGALAEAEPTIREALQNWRELQAATADDWRARLAKSVTSWRQLESLPPPFWYEALHNRLGPDGAAAAVSLFAAPLNLDERGWRISAVKRGRELLAMPFIKPGEDSFRRGYLLLPNVEWREAGLGEVIGRLRRPPGNSTLPAKVEAFAAVDEAVKALSEAWRPLPWRHQAPSWSSSPRLLKQIVGELKNKKGGAGVEAFVWFVEEWARSRLEGIKKPSLRRPYLELLSELEGASSG